MKATTLFIVLYTSIGILLLSLFQSANASNVDNAGNLFDQNIKENSYKYELHCLKKNRVEDLILTESGKDEKNHYFQKLSFAQDQYSIEVTKIEQKLLVKILAYGKELAKHLVPYEFNFDTTLDLLQLNMFQDPKLKFLSEISCRLSPKIYNFFHKSMKPLVIGIHTEIKYFSLTSVEWFDNLMDEFPLSMRLITRDTTVLNQGQSYVDHSYLDGQLDPPSNIVVSHREPTDYKLSPGGWLLFKFAPESSDTIVLSGGFLNMCMSNTMVQIAAAFLSSNKESVHILISNLNSYVQDWGMTNGLTLPIPKGAFPLWLLKDKEPEAYAKLFKGLKQYLEVMSKNRMEVVFNDEHPNTSLPVFRISIIQF